MKVRDVVGTEIKIEMISITEKSIKAKVIEVDPFWLHRGEVPFEVGMYLDFYKPVSSWILTNNKLPWFILNIENKTFEHYR